MSQLLGSGHLVGAGFQSGCYNKVTDLNSEISSPFGCSNSTSVCSTCNCTTCTCGSSIQNQIQSLIGPQARTDYGALEGDPTIAVPVGGDKYYNTTIQEEMRYDSLRDKWLSVTTFTDGLGFNGGNAATGFYRRYNGMTTSATSGVFVPKSTITKIAYTTTNAVVHTYEILLDGVVVASLASGGLASASATTDFDVDSGIISARNAAGSASTTNLQSIMFFKLRA